jgi:hypothetical protein
MTDRAGEGGSRHAIRTIACAGRAEVKNAASNTIEDQTAPLSPFGNPCASFWFWSCQTLEEKYERRPEALLRWLEFRDCGSEFGGRGLVKLLMFGGSWVRRVVVEEPWF